MPNFIQSALSPIIILMISLAVVWGLLTFRPEANPSPPTDAPSIQVSVIYANPTTQSIIVETQGTVNPKRDINLTSQVSGQVTFTADFFSRGGRFKQGDILVSIDKRDYQFALINAKAKLAQAAEALALEKVRAKQAKQEWQDLGDEEANRIFLREPQLATAHANYESALANKNQAGLNVERTNITAPFAGRIEVPLINLGQVISSGTPIARIFDSSIAEVRLPLTNQQAKLVALESLELGNRIPVSFVARVGGEELNWVGHIVETEAKIDIQSRFFYAIAEIKAVDNPEHPIIMGAFVEASIIGRPIKDVIKLPIEALTGRDTIQVVNSESVVHSQSVSVLKRDATHTWITGELTQSTPVIVNRPIDITEGSRVKIIEKHDNNNTAINEK